MGPQCQAGPGSLGASSWGTRGAFGRWARQEGASVPSLKTRKLYPTCCKVHFEGGFLLLCVAPVTVQLGMRLRGRCRKFREGWEKTGAGVPTSVLYQSEDHHPPPPPVSQEHQTSAVSSSERGDETGSNGGRRGKAAWLGAGCFLTGVGRSCPHILNPRSFPQRALCRSSVLCRSCLLSLTTKFLTQVLESKDLKEYFGLFGPTFHVMPDSSQTATRAVLAYLKRWQLPPNPRQPSDSSEGGEVCT